MARRGLTSEWSIELDDSFANRVVDGSLQMLSVGPPVRTVWMDVWSLPLDVSPMEFLADIRQDAHPHPAQRFEEEGAEPGELRYASWYREAEGERVQWGLYAYTVRAGSYVQAAFLADEADLQWALGAWRSLRHQQQIDRQQGACSRP